MTPPKCAFSRACMRAPISDFALFAFTTFTRFRFSATACRWKRGSYDKKRGRFFEKSPTFFRLSPMFFSFAPTFFNIASGFTKNLLFRVAPAAAVFLAFCAHSFYIFSPGSRKLQKNVYKEGILTFVSVACTTICEGCESKKAILQGARAYAHARDLDFTFVYLTISL